MKKTKGFTLIEVLVVVGIIGVLASILLIGLGTLRRKGADTRRIADIRTMQNALEIYATKCGAYPGVSPVAPPGCDTGTVAATWATLESAIVDAAIGITKIPYDPATAGGRDYTYARGPSTQEYVLMATLDDGDNTALADDVDGTVFTVACDDPNYCVQF